MNQYRAVPRVRMAQKKGDFLYIKIVSVLLALALTLTLVGSAVAEDKVNLTAFQYTLENQSTDFNNLWFFQQIEKRPTRTLTSPW